MPIDKETIKIFIGKFLSEEGLEGVSANNTSGTAGIGVAVGGDPSQAEPGYPKNKKKRKLRELLPLVRRTARN